MSRKLTTEEFINKSTQIHGTRYDYSKVNYTATKNKIVIICKEHGEWLQTPSNHLQGFGCQKCAINTRSNIRKNTLEEFIEKANLKHNNTYDYSKSIYITSHEKICIICSLHGEFYQEVSSHLNGKGCPKCKNRNQTTKDVIERCIKIHGNDFDYSELRYIKMKDKVDIKCNSCNTWFSQNLDKHINMKQGCPICKESKGEKLIRHWLINNNINFIPQQELFLHKLCKNTNMVKVDFTINYNSKQYIIEYDGIQHFEYDEFYHKNDIENFNKQKRRDEVLEEYCALNNIVLIKIKYDMNETNIIKILETIKIEKYD